MVGRLLTLESSGNLVKSENLGFHSLNWNRFGKMTLLSTWLCILNFENHSFRISWISKSSVYKHWLCFKVKTQCIILTFFQTLLNCNDFYLTWNSKIFFRNLPWSVIFQLFKPSKSPHLGSTVWAYRLWLYWHGWYSHGDRNKSYWFHSGVLCPLECQGSCQSCSLLYPQNLVKYQEYCEAWQGDGRMILSLFPRTSFSYV